MPSRIVQTLCATLFVIVVLFSDKSTVESLIYIIPTGILVAAAFSMGTLVNNYWFARFPPRLTTYEANWVKRFVPFYPLLDAPAKKRLEDQLAFELLEKEFISMAEKEIPEELKMMALVPSIRLNLLHTNDLAEKYNRVIFYHHAFASPDKQYIHLCETQHEDGALVFASDALEAAYLKPDRFFNTALYEWSRIFILIHNINNSFPLDEEKAWEIIPGILSLEKNTLLVYLGEPDLDHMALLCYAYVMFPEEVKNKIPDFYELMNTLIL